MSCSWRRVRRGAAPSGGWPYRAAHVAPPGDQVLLRPAQVTTPKVGRFYRREWWVLDMVVDNSLGAYGTCSRGGGGGLLSQSMNVGNDCGTSRPPFLGFHRFQNWYMYNHRSNFWLIFLNCFSPEGGKAVEIVPNIDL